MGQGARCQLRDREKVGYALGECDLQGASLSTTHPIVFGKARPESEAHRIPVLDVGPFLAREPGALARVGQDVRQALEDIGFFFIKNHGVAQELIDRVFAENARFHAQPLERKLSVKVNSKGIGYMPSGLQQPKYNQEALSTYLH
jgi:hypothetical protein